MLFQKSSFSLLDTVGSGFFHGEGLGADGDGPEDGEVIETVSRGLEEASPSDCEGLGNLKVTFLPTFSFFIAGVRG